MGGHGVVFIMHTIAAEECERGLRGALVCDLAPSTLDADMRGSAVRAESSVAARLKEIRRRRNSAKQLEVRVHRFEAQLVQGWLSALSAVLEVCYEIVVASMRQPWAVCGGRRLLCPACRMCAKMPSVVVRRRLHHDHVAHPQHVVL